MAAMGFGEMQAPFGGCFNLMDEAYRRAFQACGSDSLILEGDAMLREGSQSTWELGKQSWKSRQLSPRRKVCLRQGENGWGRAMPEGIQVFCWRFCKLGVPSGVHAKGYAMGQGECAKGSTPKMAPGAGRESGCCVVWWLSWGCGQAVVLLLIQASYGGGISRCVTLITWRLNYPIITKRELPALLRPWRSTATFCHIV